MDELRESSLLFSLEGLMETERERVQREAREAERRREEELSRVTQMAERRRQAAQQEREARERRQALEQERERLEQQHIDAIKHGTIERARIEAEARVRLVEVEQQRRHELSLSQLREAERTARYRGLTWLSSGALVLALLGGATAYFGLLAPAQARTEQHLQSVISSSAEQTKAAQRALLAERSLNQTLNERIKQLEAQKPVVAVRPEPKVNVTGPVRPPQPPRPPSGDCPDDGDPMSKCFPGSRRR